MAFIKLSVYPNNDIGVVDIILPISKIDHVVEVDSSSCTVVFTEELSAFGKESLFCHHSVEYIYKTLELKLAPA